MLRVRPPQSFLGGKCPTIRPLRLEAGRPSPVRYHLRREDRSAERDSTARRAVTTTDPGSCPRRCAGRSRTGATTSRGRRPPMTSGRAPNFPDRAAAPTPPTLAVIDTNGRSFPGTRATRTGRGVRRAVARGLPGWRVPVLQAQPGDRQLRRVRRGRSRGRPAARRVRGLDVVRRVRSGPDRRRTHPRAARAAQLRVPRPPWLATVRVYLLRAEMPFAVIKMAARGNVAHNYWRPGNLPCDVDAATGAIPAARSQDAFGARDHAAHPESGEPLADERLPMRDRVIRLARECSAVSARSATSRWTWPSWRTGRGWSRSTTAACSTFPGSPRAAAYSKTRRGSSSGAGATAADAAHAASVPMERRSSAATRACLSTP